jgi:hypothetical protein
MIYLARQISQFRFRGKEFSMQRLRTESQIHQGWREVWATLSPQEQLVGLYPEERLQEMSPDEVKQAWRDWLTSLTPEERLRGLSPEERLRGLSPEERERLRQLFQQPPHQPEAPSSPE